MIKISIPGAPVPKARPRAAIVAGSPRLYTPAETRAYEQVVAMAARMAMCKAPPITGPVCVMIDVRIKPPASWSQRKQQMALDGEIAPSSRPDLDNYIKSIMDGLNREVWADDAQVVKLAASKSYGASPGVDVLVTEYRKGD